MSKELSVEHTKTDYRHVWKMEVYAPWMLDPHVGYVWADEASLYSPKIYSTPEEAKKDLDKYVSHLVG